MRRLVPYVLLLTVKGIARLLWTFEAEWVGVPPAGDRWSGIRLVVILNHTSLYEWVFAGIPPNRFLRKIARHGVVPVAAKTLERRWVGKFFGMVAAHVVSLSRQRDETWRSVLDKVGDPKAMVVILPEGRMLRPTGFDADGRPMTIRGGVVDLVDSIPEGRILFAYSGGLHHVQAPGELLPRLFRTVRMSFEVVDVAAYRERMRQRAGATRSFRAAVIADLEQRLLRHCPVRPGTAPIPLRRDAG